jgi:signal peptidase I
VTFLLVAIPAAIHAWVLEGFTWPIRVVSGSMGEALSGPCWSVPCGDCGFEFLCDIACPPPNKLAVCPNCGFAQNRLDDSRILPGRRVLIDRLTFHTRQPHRFEVVVAWLEGVGRTVKRVVGLPGEQVEVRDGDVYVDGAIVRKTPEEFAATALLVHDDAHRSRQADAVARWAGSATPSGWHTVQGGYEWDRVRSAGPDSDWLVYRHQEGLPPRACQAVFDNDSFNQGISRRLHPVGDLAVTLACLAPGPGTFQLRLTGKPNDLVVSVSPSAQTATLESGPGQPIASSSGVVVGPHCHIAFGSWDRQIVFRVNGTTLFWVETPAGLTVTGGTPVAVRASGFDTCRLSDLRVWRDIYYTHPQGIGRPWTLAGPLAHNEFLLLGDNSPRSIDGRHHRKLGVASRQELVGRVLPAPHTMRDRGQRL